MPDTAPKPEEPDPGYAQEDWDEVSDNPKLTEADLAALRPAREVPEVFKLLPKRGRGRPRRADAKVNFTMRIDPALLDAYRATGDGWQVRMHEILAGGLEPSAARRGAETADVAARRGIGRRAPKGSKAHA
ncbi:BrnA antitoxin family protein [Methylobacterium sp. J-026]|uniref:BrnA antitoxin family protein n=1 Tax=Methylobacterium sp. J-026 TaxID=2836624 RepID=UPI001FBA7C6C|nr:BrnA antitoxin family protein [Methylobacterium sp. J-026]MCJ2137801.1 BrnA antitoxin family protein [Methylobacterium sp. J-026]